MVQREFTTLGISANMDMFVRQRGEPGQASVPIPPKKETNMFIEYPAPQYYSSITISLMFSYNQTLWTLNQRKRERRNTYVHKDSIFVKWHHVGFLRWDKSGRDRKKRNNLMQPTWVKNKIVRVQKYFKKVIKVTIFAKVRLVSVVFYFKYLKIKKNIQNFIFLWLKSA